jgi:hypothetical protein
MAPFAPTEEDLRKQAQNEANIRELERLKMDTFEVYNPMDTDFKFMQDRYWHVVKAHETKEMPRYLAKHYAKKIVEFMINQQIQKEGEELKALREKQMGTAFRDAYVENVEVWDKVPRANDPELVAEHMKMLRIRKVMDYGMEPEAQQEAPAPLETLDNRSSYEKAFDDISEAPQAQQSRPQAPVMPSEASPVIKDTSIPPLYKSKKDLAREAAEATKNG